MSRGLSQALSEAEDIRRTQGNAAGDSLTEGLIDKAVKGFYSDSKGLWCS